MFVIDPTTNTIASLAKRSFSELGFKERAHLQEWIAGNPASLGENLLIIQKEFNGFSDTYERLDLLALDKNGNVVVIENKLDDSGKDVTWQALKYAAYCSTLTREQLEQIFQDYLNTQKIDKTAIQVLEEYFDETPYQEININRGSQQRIIMIAANFRKEVTSTVLWLMNFKIKLQCFKATPYELNGQYFLTLEQIIPTKDAQDYVISMTNKVYEEISTEEEVKTRHKKRLKFWAEFLKTIKGKSDLFQNSNPTKEVSLAAGGADITYVTFQVVITTNYALATLNFGRMHQSENKCMFDELLKYKTEIENAFGGRLEWERKEDTKKSAVSVYRTGVNYFHEDDWPSIISFLIENINKLEGAVRPYMPKVKTVLQNSIKDNQELLEEEQS